MIAYQQILFQEWFSEQTKDAVNVPSHTSKDLGVEDFHFDSLIGKGCNAVVYSAKLRTETSGNVFFMIKLNSLR